MKTYEDLKVTYFSPSDLVNQGTGTDIFDRSKLTTEGKKLFKESSICIFQYSNGNCIVVKSRY